MKLQLKRIYKGDTYTIGKLYIDGEYFCDTVEGKVRQLPAVCSNTSKWQSCKCKEKVYAQTAIPAGIYKITMEYSPRFKRGLPFLHDVPHFLGILIHSGNTEKDTAGCIIVGKNTIKGKVLESKVTLGKLIARLSIQQEITIEIM